MISAARALVDTGFLVGLISHDDAWHAWAANAAREVRGPWLTCEACVTEAYYLLGKISSRDAQKVLAMLDQGALVSQHLLPDQLANVQAEVARYHDRLVDFADACLMVLSDMHPRLPLVTVDTRDFTVYLRGRGPRRLVAPG